MTIWIVEDVDNDAAVAEQAIAEVAQSRPRSSTPRTFRNRTIQWQDTIEASNQTVVSIEDCAPSIVILDLFVDGNFAAQKFYNQLRHWETMRRKPKSRVILWSVRTGLAEAQDLLSVLPRTDLRLGFTEIKEKQPLKNKLSACWQSWEDERHQ